MVAQGRLAWKMMLSVHIYEMLAEGVLISYFPISADIKILAYYPKYQIWVIFPQEKFSCWNVS